MAEAEQQDAGPLVRVGRAASGAAATLTLCSPHNRNALSARLLRELHEGLAAAEADPAVRVVVLAAEGPVFCSGADLAERLAAAAEPATPAPEGPGLPEVLAALRGAGTPVVAVVGGHVRAGGIGLVAAADVALGAASATFAFTEVRVGVAPAIIAVAASRVMAARALARHTLTGEVFDAPAAAACGLLSEVVPDEALAARADEVVGAFGDGAPGAVAATKAFLDSVPGESFGADLARAAALSDRLFAGPDAVEGMAAFLEKRPPRWRVAT